MMNSGQKTILFVGILVIVAMFCMPPWQHVEQGEAALDMGYGPIWKPPSQQQQAKANILGFKIQMDLPTVTANQIDFGRLGAQIGVAVLATAGLFAVAGRRKGVL